MTEKINISGSKNKRKGKSLSNYAYLLFISLAIILTACSELKKPETEPYYAETSPPPKQEFRWSNGKSPKSFDPALAAAPPETDIARAIFEGLTETNSKNLEPVPAIAIKWNSEENNRVWIFHLRRDAKWSNGEIVKAEDFVRSWMRAAELGKDVSHPDLLSNIAGVEFVQGDDQTTESSKPADGSSSLLKPTDQNSPAIDESPLGSFSGTSKRRPAIAAPGVVKPDAISKAEKPETDKLSAAKNAKQKNERSSFGVEADGDFTLKVSLKSPDKDFPALVAHPLFRPVYPETNFEKLNAGIVTNGAFRISSVGQDGVTLDRAETYWNKENVKLERVRFIPKQNAEAALEAYRAGEIDAVTNSEIEPLALKLLMPYEDFRQTVHSALNLYEINPHNQPFDDKRVREALAISIERERLTDDEMDGSTKPALGFQPYVEAHQAKLTQDFSRAKKLLSEAGFPDGENFPKVKLLINRNNIQQRIARSVAKMWKQNLNIETEIIVKEPDEIESVIATGEYDIVRRGVVLPTSDETVNMLAIFSSKKSNEYKPLHPKSSEAFSNGKLTGKPASGDSTKDLNSTLNPLIANETSDTSDHLKNGELILSEDAAIDQLLAIPLYFPMSYSLVKPYVLGFEINTLDASSLLDVSIDNNWQPKNVRKQS